MVCPETGQVGFSLGLVCWSFRSGRVLANGSSPSGGREKQYGNKNES